jgi:hypothetical protein
MPMLLVLNHDELISIHNKFSMAKKKEDDEQEFLNSFFLQ